MSGWLQRLQQRFCKPPFQSSNLWLGSKLLKLETQQLPRDFRNPSKTRSLHNVNRRFNNLTMRAKDTVDV